MTERLPNTTILKCPSCGSPMGEPDFNGLVQCSYCGTKIVLPPTETAKEQKNLARYKELCQVERQGKKLEKFVEIR